jgi:hypothetical protein
MAFKHYLLLHFLLPCLLSYVMHQQHKQKGEILCYAFYLICIIVLQVIFHVRPVYRVFRTPLYSLSACFLSRFSWISIGEGKPISGMGVLEINLKVPVV